MSTLATSVIVGLCIYFMLMTVTLVVNNMLKKKRVSQAVSGLVEQVKSHNEGRQNELQSWLSEHSSIVPEQVDTRVENCMRGEMKFYQTLAGMLTTQNMETLQHFPMIVDGLVSPYKYLSNKSYNSSVDPAAMKEINQKYDQVCSDYEKVFAAVTSLLGEQENPKFQQERDSAQLVAAIESFAGMAEISEAPAAASDEEKESQAIIEQLRLEKANLSKEHETALIALDKIARQFLVSDDDKLGEERLTLEQVQVLYSKLSK